METFEIFDLVRENSISGPLVTQQSATKAGFTDAFSLASQPYEPRTDEESARDIGSPMEEATELEDTPTCDEEPSPAPEARPAVDTSAFVSQSTEDVMDMSHSRKRRVGRPRGDSVGSVPTSERPRRAATIRKAEDSEPEDYDSNDDDLSGEGVAYSDLPREIERVKGQLRDKMRDLNDVGRSNKGHSPADRKKVCARNFDL